MKLKFIIIGVFIACFSCKAQEKQTSKDCYQNAWAKWIENKLPESICIKEDEMIYSPVPDMLGGRSFFEDIMAYYRYTKSSGWKHTADISQTGADIRQQTMDVLEHLHKLAKADDALAQVKTFVGNEVEQYIDETVSLDAQGRYNQGKLIFEVASAFFGVAEAKALLKTGKLTSNLLSGLASIPERFKIFIKKGVLKIEKSSRKIGVVLDATKLGMDDATLLASKWIKPENGWYDVVIHGTPDNFMVNTGNKWVKITHRDLVNFLKSIGYSQNKPIRLISCNTGVFPDAIGKDLANKIGAEVKAPKGLITIFEDGSYKISNSGEWRIFKPGQ